MYRSIRRDRRAVDIGNGFRDRRAAVVYSRGGGFLRQARIIRLARRRLQIFCDDNVIYLFYFTRI